MATMQLPARKTAGPPWNVIALIAVAAVAVVAVAALAYQAVTGTPVASSPVINVPGVTAATDSVTVIATGSVPAVPDMMTVTIGAQVSRGSAREALQAAGDKAASLANVLKQQGVDPKDIQTQYVNVWRNDNYGQVSYVANNQLRVVIRDLSKASAILGAASDALGNELSMNGIALSRHDSTAELNQARQLAMQAAAGRAEQWSKLTGRKLGKVLSVNEGGFGYTNYGGGQGGGIGGGGGVPIESGSGVVEVQVAVTYHLD